MNLVQISGIIALLLLFVGGYFTIAWFMKFPPFEKSKQTSKQPQANKQQIVDQCNTLCGGNEQCIKGCVNAKLVTFCANECATSQDANCISDCVNAQ